MYMTRQVARQVVNSFSHFVGRISGRYYFEDYTRVYPDQVAYTRFGWRRRARANDLKNYRSHRRFYEFASQFVREKTVADVGCGSGYGCEILKQQGARQVHGCDLSRSSLRFARNKYGAVAEFTKQGITDLLAYDDSRFDVVVSSEVLEHIKEYNMEDKALQELKRIMRTRGILVVGTPNAELLPTHGFSFAELRTLFSAHFDKYCIFENALIPFGEHKKAWERRLAEGNIGVVVSQDFNPDESIVPEGADPESKVGLAPGRYLFHNLEIDTTLLRNSISWVIVAVK